MSAKNPQVTVLMPVYNAEKYLSQAIDSILNQSYQDFEFVIIDDGSKDDSAKIVSEYKDERIRFFQNEKNLGLTKTLNKGISLARGKYIARMDADDISREDRLLKQVEYLEKNKGCVLLGSDAIVVDEKGRELNYYAAILNYSGIQMGLNFRSMFTHSSVMFRRDIVLELKGYDETKKAEDFDLWSRLSDEGALVNLPFPLIKYRLNTTGIMANNEQSLANSAGKIAVENWSLYEKDFNSDEVWDRGFVDMKPKYLRRMNYNYLRLELAQRYLSEGNLKMYNKYKQAFRVDMFKNLIPYAYYIIRNRIKYFKKS